MESARLPPRPSEQPEFSELRASLSVVQTLVHSLLAGDAAALEGTLASARLAMLLAARAKLSAWDTHRVILAVWVAGLHDWPALRHRFARQHDIEPLLADAQPADAEPSDAALIMSLLRAWAKAGQDTGTPPAALAKVRARLMADWASTERRRGLLDKLIALLRADLREGAPARGHRIQVISPDESLAPVLSAALRSAGYEVTVDGDGEAARRRIAESVPDAVICERDLSPGDGLALCRELRHAPATAHVPFFLVIGRGNRRLTTLCLEAGADEVVVRPVDIRWLLLKLDRALRRNADESSAGGVKGSLADIGFAEMIQILAAAQKTVRIRIVSERNEGEIVIDHGDVIHAEMGGERGENAFYRMMGWRDGSFAALPCEQLPPRTVTASLMGLLLEGARLVDETANAGA